MSIYGTIIALNLAMNSSPSVNHRPIQQIDRVAQKVPLGQINDGIRDGRVQLDRLIKIIRSQPKLTPLKKATGVSNLYFRRADLLYLL